MNNSSLPMLPGNGTSKGMFDMFQNSYEIHRIAAPELLIVDRVVTPIWYTLGIVGNPLSARIWLSKKVRSNNSSALYLGSIAVVHTIFIFLHLCMELLQAWGLRTYNRQISCEIFMVLYITPQYLAPFLIFGFTFERYIAICHPFLKRQVCTVRRATTVILAMSSVAIVFALCQAYVWAYDTLTGVCEIRQPAEGFYFIWTWISEMLVFAAVPLCVLLLNIFVIKEIKRINQYDIDAGRRDNSRSSNQTSTITLLSVSFYLICTLLPATIVYTIQLCIHPGDLKTPPQDWSTDQSWSSYLTYYHIRRVIEEICFSNYASYAIIYYITSSFFREEVQRICCIPCSRPGSDLKYDRSNSETYSVLVVTNKSSVGKDSTLV